MPSSPMSSSLSTWPPPLSSARTSAEVQAFAERAAAGATEPTEVAIRTCTSAEAG